MVTIKTDKFVLRNYRKGDEFYLQKNINNKKIEKHTLKIPYPYTLLDAKKWISYNLNLNKKKKKTEINFIIEIDNEVVGSIGLSNINEFKGELGYWLAEKHWGKGIITSATKKIINYGFNELNLKRIYAYVFPENIASQKVMKKAGMKYEGNLRNNIMKKGKLRDSYIFAIIRE